MDTRGHAPINIPRRRLGWWIAAALLAAVVVIAVAGAATASSRAARSAPLPAPAAGAAAGGGNQCGLNWRVVPAAPNPGPDSAFGGLAVVAANDIWAVGSYSDSVTLIQRPLAEHWNGSTWTGVPVPAANGADNGLHAVAAVAPANVWAVGNYESGSGQSLTLIEHWDGSTWTVVPSANPGSMDNNLTGIVAVSASEIWAVGASNSGGFDNTLVERWNGTAWLAVPSPNVGSQDNELVSVAVAGPNNVWAVGDAGADNGTSPKSTLTEHWNGTAWAVVPSPNPTTVSDGLDAVAVLGPSDIWAVGDARADANSSTTLALHWDGTAWSIVPTPSITSPDYAFDGLVAIASNDVWAVGEVVNASQTAGATLTEHWDGSAWTVVPSPSPGSGFNSLNAAAAVNGQDVWAVGDTESGGPTSALIERYSLVPCPTPTPCSGFSDVHPADYFYTAVQYLVAHGVISGYGDCTFRPYANTTRSQMVKIVVLGFNKTIVTPPGGAYTFQDVPPSFPFFAVIETAAANSIVSGYGCGGPGEPCLPPPNRPYFRPYANVTRGQLSKIDVVAAGWTLLDPGTPTFLDVLRGSPFYTFVETAVCHGVISGYADHTFRPGNAAIRGQIAKIVYLSVTGAGTCVPPTAVR